MCANLNTPIIDIKKIILRKIFLWKFSYQNVSIFEFQPHMTLGLILYNVLIFKILHPIWSQKTVLIRKYHKMLGNAKIYVFILSCLEYCFLVLFFASGSHLRLLGCAFKVIVSDL